MQQVMAAAIVAFAAKGAEFRVSRVTLGRNKIDAKKKILPEASIVPSGVAVVSTLQFNEGFAYLRA
jgi:uncharacterized protein